MDEPISVEYRQRAYDGKWEKIGRFLDHSNSYTYGNETGSKVTLVPERWITMNIYDYEIIFEE